MPMRVSKSAFVSCADEASGSAKKAVAPSISDQFCNLVRMSYPFLEVKVKSGQEFTGVDIGGRYTDYRSRAVLVQPVVFVVPGKTGSGSHERIEPEANRIGRDIAVVGSRRAARSSAGYATCAVGLPRHPDRFIPTDENQLRTIYIVGLQQDSVPCRRLRSGRQRRPWHIVSSHGAADQISVALTEPGVVLAMLGNNLKVDVLAKVKLSH